MADEKKIITTNELLFYHTAIKALLADKVAKEEGKSLLSNTEIERLKTLVNYDDTTVKSDIENMKSQISALEAGTYDDTDIKKQISDVDTKIGTTATSTLTSANSYTDAEIQKVKNSQTAAMHYKGSVSNYADLPTDATVGDFYNIVNASDYNKAGDNAVRTDEGTWDITAGIIDISSFITNSDLATNSDIETILKS